MTTETCTITQAELQALHPKWYCLRSQTNGKLVTQHTDEEGDFCGPVLVFFDKEDAEVEAIAHRETYPLLMIEVTELPASPPAVVRQDPREQAEIAASLTALSWAEEYVTIEVRPRTGSPCRKLMKVITEGLRFAAQAQPTVHRAPVTFIRLGPITTQHG